MYFTKSQKIFLALLIIADIITGIFFIYIKSQYIKNGSLAVLIGITLAVIGSALIFMLFGRKYKKLLMFARNLGSDSSAWICIEEMGTKYLLFIVDSSITRIAEIKKDHIKELYKWENGTIQVTKQKVALSPLRDFEGLSINQGDQVIKKILLYNLKSNIFSRPIKRIDLDNALTKINSYLSK